jgi:rare lipoprotein A (peptidoglycan hydrolase)
MNKIIGLILSLFLISVTWTQTDILPVVKGKDTVLHKVDTVFRGVDSTKSLDSLVLTGKVVKGIASFYSANLDGTETATGEIFRNSKFTAASNNLKLNTWVKVTNLKNGKTVVVRINDRMHPNMKKKGRVIDLSRAAAKKLDFMESGLTKVRLDVIEPPKKQEIKNKK